MLDYLRAQAVLPAGGFGNFDPGIMIARGSGSYVRDEDGNEYIDYLIGSGPMLLGRGQHPALIDPERWDDIQRLLQDDAAKVRHVKTGTARSLLCGKLFDETGDRLTRSHTKTRTGKRLRYYVSHRLIAKSGEDRDGWRLPAPELEEQIAALMRNVLAKPSFVPSFVPDASASQIGVAKMKLVDWLERDGTKHILKAIETVTISPRHLAC